MDVHAKPSLQGWPSWLLYPVRQYPAILVAFLVMIILKGFGGASKGIVDQLSLFAASFLDDGSNDIASVLWRTAPLAFSVAVITFAGARRWLKLDVVGIVVGAVIIIGGARLGDALTTPNQVTVATGITTQNDPMEISGLVIPQSDLPPHLAKVISQPIHLSQDVPELPPGAAPPPVQLLPQIGGWPGQVFAAINQLIGYFQHYQPRLFLAALIVGAYLGWRWHSALNWISELLAAKTAEVIRLSTPHGQDERRAA